MIQEFRKFIMRGNVFDMAVGIIIGGAFGAVVTSLVNDIIMPPIGLALGGVDFASLFINLSGSYKTIAAAKEAGAATINYGLFINTIITFLVIALVIFLLVKQVNRMKEKEVPAPVAEKECPFCFTSIPIKATRCPNCTSELKTV